MKLLYDLWYRHGTPPWVGRPRQELVRLVTDGTLTPGRAIDLGCGVGDNAIFLAQHGFTVTGVDFADAAIERGRAKAFDAGVDVSFIVDDLTHLRHISGPFDLLVDYGTLDDLDDRGRDAYVREVVALTRPGTQFLLWCFEWTLAPWEHAATALLPFGGLTLAPGEVAARFGRQFEVHQIAGEQHLRGWPRGWAAYLMTRLNG
ncbi:MAG TPA: class I SAM-dependent methyltransferase [Propionicimonas sp.]|uniref:class I SAM-dependent methyltransferase n=1 Tax=Propionicimonas sp. TaxID=1955623 RepID=UPI002F41B067